ncbi:MAG TPA: indolepyruvate ferredoxin oxidoreductase subunit alpha [Anaerolineae bacterium]|nr:indolepyruvate ferredoxin oxidoreductase subunit alpha [Anaerolineae bacterium]HOR00313.1 indolepyruvate ferredoxin oxidoreductase subunit alpha [Anaerolineae bacterium]HPL28603.1 indolepyruvate ferredoxin oxidoreductase subunit alpha [Anaerolineae bacterium]
MTARVLLSGNEAVARGAWESGVRVASAYPGTPSTEILESLATYDDVVAEWAPNEKVALDVAIGAAYAGVRAMAVMKHVGLNVAADSLFYAAMTGMEAGLLIVAADDPDMHSSQNEQDNRRYCKFARLPCFEPSDSQDAKDLVGVALALSEQFDTPVMLRPTTRIAHSSTVVELGERAVGQASSPAGPSTYRIDTAKYVMVPGNARRRHPVIEERIERLAAWAETFPGNRLEWRGRRLGIVTCGVAYQYAREVFPEASILRLGMSYPIPAGLVRQLAAGVERLIVLEELDPFLEEEIRLLGIALEGKSIFPRCGELNPAIVRDGAIAAGLLPESARLPAAKPTTLPLPARPPILCPGCPHRAVFHVLRKLKLVVNGDIGCYTLAFQPPQGALHSCGCMGASIGVAHGVARAGLAQKNVAVLGDSTFFHSGLPALLNVAYNQGSAATIILDNRTTAMTGHQENPGTGRTLRGAETTVVDLVALVRSLGIARVYEVDSYDLQAVEQAVRAAIDGEGPGVVIARRECVLLPAVRPTWHALTVDAERCNGCGLCLQLGCPALVKSEARHAASGRAQVRIDPLLCTGCAVCAQVCNRNAIPKK